MTREQMDSMSKRQLDAAFQDIVDSVPKIHRLEFRMKVLGANELDEERKRSRR